MQKTLRTATIAGLDIQAHPVPFRHIRRIFDAEKRDDDTDKILAIADTVAECVTRDDGRPVDVDELTVEQINELYRFAVLNERKTTADFTPAASPDGTATAPTPPPPPTS